MDWKHENMDWDLDWSVELLMLELEANRKRLHEILDGRSIRELSFEERLFAIHVLRMLVRLKQLEDLTFTEIAAILEELIYTLAEEFRINPLTTNDWERQLFYTIELEKMKGQSVKEIIADRLFLMPIWDDMCDWLMPEAFAAGIYDYLKRASNK